MTIVPIVLAAVLLVAGALFGILLSGRGAAHSRSSRSSDAGAGVVVGGPSQFASGSVAIPRQGRPRLPGLTRTRPVPALGPLVHRPLRRLPSNVFSDES